MKTLKIFITLISLIFLCSFSITNAEAKSHIPPVVTRIKIPVSKHSVAGKHKTHMAEIQRLLRQTHNLKPKLVRLGYRAYRRAKRAGLAKKPILTIIDYHLASTKRRFWVINVDTDKVLFFTHVAHGKGSGNDFSKHFSDRPGTDASSIGVYLTGNAYIGKHGYSLRLYGLDEGYNDEAYKRTIVIHQAWYVSHAFIKKYGRLGRSWGCPALEHNIYKQVITAIKDGSVILAYFPDKGWLKSSIFVKPRKQAFQFLNGKIWQIT